MLLACHLAKFLIQCKSDCKMLLTLVMKRTTQGIGVREHSSCSLQYSKMDADHKILQPHAKPSHPHAVDKVQLVTEQWHVIPGAPKLPHQVAATTHVLMFNLSNFLTIVARLCET